MILFFLPHAGGSARSYCTFKRFLPKNLTVIPMEVAGRGARANEPLFHDIKECCADLLEHHRNTIAEGNYMFFGHSMGTMLASELTWQIEAQGLPMPSHVFLSGRCAPDADISCLSDQTASDDEIADFFFQKDLLPKPMQGAEELMATLKRILCADVRMVDSVRMQAKDFRFPCDISVLYGTEDSFLQNCDMSDWQHFTNGKCSVYPFSGGHFYYQQNLEAVCDIITNTI